MDNFILLLMRFHQWRKWRSLLLTVETGNGIEHQLPIENETLNLKYSVEINASNQEDYVLFKIIIAT
jgi:hypothetical protein